MAVAICSLSQSRMFRVGVVVHHASLTRYVTYDTREGGSNEEAGAAAVIVGAVRFARSRSTGVFLEHLHFVRGSAPCVK